jgi:hypothetical protein
MWAGLRWLRREFGEQDNEHSSSIKGGEYLDYLSDY